MRRRSERSRACRATRGSCRSLCGLRSEGCEERRARRARRGNLVQTFLFALCVLCVPDLRSWPRPLDPSELYSALMTPSDERWDVIGVGANSVDFVNLLPGYPQPFGSFAKMQIRDRRVLCGGQTATAMCTCASLGLRSKYVGVSGTDENGRRIRAELTKRGIDITDLIIRDAENQFAVILVDETTGERIVLWDRDDRLRLRERELPTEALSAARAVHVDDVDEDAAIRAAKIARHAGAIVTSDIDRLTPRTEELVASVTHAIFARHVPTHLTGTNDMERALRKLRQSHTHTLCVTMGEHGAMALQGDHFVHEPAF